MGRLRFLHCEDNLYTYENCQDVRSIYHDSADNRTSHQWRRSKTADSTRFHTFHSSYSWIWTDWYLKLSISNQQDQMFALFQSVLSISTNQNGMFPQLMWWRAYQMFISNWERCTRDLCPFVKIIPCFIYSSPRLGNQATTSQSGWMVDRVVVQCRGFCRRTAGLPGNPAPTNQSLMSIHGLI